jgi:hypothetical protein
MTIDQIWEHIEKGSRVHWATTLYEVHRINSNGSRFAKVSERNSTALRVSCTDNYFGSYISEADAAQCFVGTGQPTYA